MFIYLVTNLVNGKQYVGQTVQTVEKRFKRHCWKSTTMSPKMPITEAIQKYGKENFKVETLQTCSSIEELNDREAFYIDKYDTIAPKGYNLQKGGNSPGFMHESTKQKISLKNKGRKATDLTKARLSASHKGLKMSEASKQKLSVINSGKQPSPQCKANSIKAAAKTYILINPEGQEITITNMAKFCREHGLSKQDMCEVIKRRQTAHKGWKVSTRDTNGDRIRTLSNDAKQHLSSINTGKVRSIESKRKQSQSLLGKQRSPESLKKLSDSLKLAYKEGRRKAGGRKSTLPSTSIDINDPDEVQ